MPATIANSACLWRLGSSRFPTAATLHVKYPEIKQEVMSEEQSWLYVSLHDDKFRGTLQQIQHIPMTPPVPTLKAEKENVIQSLRNNLMPTD